MSRFPNQLARITRWSSAGRALATAATAGATLLVGALPAAAADRPMRFEHLTIRDGLSQSTVLDIHQDRDGFLWLATEDGLNRYDGRNVVHYKQDAAGGEASLPADFVWAIDEDAAGDLWLATEGGGVVRYERASGRFRALRADPREAGSVASDFIRTLHVDAGGAVWIGTRGAGLDRLDPASGRISHYRHAPGDEATLPSDDIYAVLSDQSGALWVGTDAGLARLDPASQSFRRFTHDPADPGSLSNDRVRTVYEDRSGQLWVGTRRGLNRLRPDGGFVRYLHAAGDPASLGHNLVRSIFEDDARRLWVGTQGGLNLLNRSTGVFTRYRHDRSDPDSLGENEVMSLFQDRGGLLWVGTRTAGVSRWNPRTWSFGHRMPAPAGREDGAARQVTAFAETADGRVLVGTLGSGLQAIDLASGESVRIDSGSSRPAGLTDDRVMSLLADGRGALWVGTMGGGLHRLDAGASRFRLYRHDPADPASLGADAIASLYEDGTGEIWVGTFGGGAARFDRAAEAFERLPDGPVLGLSSPRVTAFAEDATGALWIGTHNGGLNLLDRETGSLRHYRHDPGDPTSLGSDDVYALHLDSSGVLWVGTTAGLARMQGSGLAPERIRFERYTERDGLPNEVVYGIQSDERGSLWLSTNRGLARFDPISQTFESFGRSHGLQADEFNFGAHHRLADGRLLFGGNNGFNAFHPDRLARNEAQPPVVLTAFQKLDRRVETDVPLSRLEEIELDHRDSLVSFEFAALDFSAPGHNRYAYMLEGVHSDWVDLGTDNRATLTDLAPGRYVLRVKAANADGAVNEDGLAIPLSVRRAWWQTGWARGGAVALVALLAVALLGAGRRLARVPAGAAPGDEPARLQARIAELESENRRLREASLTDPVTGLRNRRFLDEQLAKELALVARRHRDREAADDEASEPHDLVFMKIDLDGFGALEESLGAAAGDRLLRRVAAVLERASRSSDLLARWRDDQFVLLARDTDPERAERLAERLRSKIAEKRFHLGGKEIGLTCSIGFSAYPFPRRRPGLLADDAVLLLADCALHQAKERGNAWVGLLAAEAPAAEQRIAHISLDEPERLVEEGLLELRRSVSDAAA